MLLEQCSCGIWFSCPLEEDENFVGHFENGLHARCCAIQICAPCFVGGCNQCERKRDEWHCYCRHHGVISPMRKNRAMDASVLFSDWMRAGCPSESGEVFSNKQGD